MKKILSIIILIMLIIPLGVRAAGKDVKSVTATVSKNMITFDGTTQDDSVAVMCKLLDDSATPVEVDKLSVEVNNAAFTGSFIAEETGTYIVSCANYDGGTIVNDEVNVIEMSTYTVTFNAKGGNLTSPASVNVTHGNTIEEPSNPELEGKTFAGWCVDATTTTLFDFSTKITASTTLYARWVDPITQVQVIYGGDGAFQVDFNTNNPADQGPMGVMINNSARYFVPSGTQVTLTAEVPQGKRFVGWYTTHEEDNPNDPGHTIWQDDDLLSEETNYTLNAEGVYINVKPVFANEEENVDDPGNEPGNNSGDESEKGSYKLDDANGNQISFKHDEGQNLSLVVQDISNLTDEELEHFEETRELYDNIKLAVAKEAKKHGTLLQYLNISVIDNNLDAIDMSNTPVSIKLKMTDDMKKYNSFKLICFDVNGQGVVSFEKPITLTVKEIDGVKYLVGNLPHLSTYALVGDTVTTTSTPNPKTYDSILNWVIALVISLGGIISIAITTRKREI